MESSSLTRENYPFQSMILGQRNLNSVMNESKDARAPLNNSNLTKNYS